MSQNAATEFDAILSSGNVWKVIRALQIDVRAFAEGRMSIIWGDRVPKSERGAISRCPYPQKERLLCFSWYAGKHYQCARTALNQVTFDHRHVDRKRELASIFWNVAMRSELTADELEGPLAAGVYPESVIGAYLWQAEENSA